MICLIFRTPKMEILLRRTMTLQTQSTILVPNAIPPKQNATYRNPDPKHPIYIYQQAKNQEKRHDNMP